MSRKFTFLSMLATGAFLGSLSGFQLAGAQQSGPVREGIRRTGEVVVESGRRVGEGTRRVAEGAADVTGQAVRRAGEGAVRAGQRAGDLARGTAQALTGDRSARWRMRQYNDRWWYYSPEGNWMYRQDEQWNTYRADANAEFQPPQVDPAQMEAQYAQQQRDGYVDQNQQQGSDSQLNDQGIRHESGYRGTTTASSQSLYYDRCGRAFVCENGRRVYVDPSTMQSDSSWSQNEQQPAVNDTPSRPQSSPTEAAKGALNQYDDGRSDATPRSTGSDANVNGQASTESEVRSAQGETQLNASQPPAEDRNTARNVDPNQAPNEFSAESNTNVDATGEGE